MHDFKKLKVWQRAREFVRRIYLTTEHFPKDEVFGLTSQIKRSSVSIPSNIAEGAGRNSKQEFCRFLDIANSSAFELETQIILSCDLDFIKQKELVELLNELSEIQKMIYGLKNNLK